MSTPITWQNIHGASLAEALRPLEGAQRSFNGAFDQLGALLQQREAIDAGNMATVRKNNTESYLNQVAELGKTPQALQKAIETGALEKIRSGFGNAIDHGATRGAAEALLDTRYKQVTAANSFTDTERDRVEFGLKDQIKGLIAQGKTKEADALLEQNTLRSEADLYQGVDSRKQVDVERDRAMTDFTRKGEKHDMDIKVSKKSLDVSNAQISHMRNQDSMARDTLGLAKQRFDQETDDRLLDRATKLRQEYGGLVDNAASSTNGSEAIYNAISRIKDPDAQNNARMAAAKLIGTPGMTTGAAISAVMGIQPDNWYTFESTMRDRVQESAKKILATPEAISSKQSGEVRKAQLMEEQLKVRLKQAERSGDKDAAAEIRKFLAKPGIKQDDDR
jgi:hypothetical protein